MNGLMNGSNWKNCVLDSVKNLVNRPCGAADWTCCDASDFYCGDDSDLDDSENHHPGNDVISGACCCGALHNRGETPANPEIHSAPCDRGRPLEGRDWNPETCLGRAPLGHCER